MLKKLLIAVAAIFCVEGLSAAGAKWISVSEGNADVPNTWIAFRKDFNLEKVPDTEKVIIAADSKYWLWINGKLAVFEGGLKRGPNPSDGYYDEIDIAPFLKSGENKIAVLLWYFGKDGFSHKGSGKAGLFFESEGETGLKSSADWLSKIHPGYGTAGYPVPNYRLSESNIKFDANRDMPGWQTADAAEKWGFKKSRECGEWGSPPWNGHQKRPIPMWKLRQVRSAEFVRAKGKEFDTVTAKLPYNMQMTPIITVNDPDGNSLIGIKTDHVKIADIWNVRAEYVTKKGKQTYESLGWMNGHHIILEVPRNVKVERVEYRESGYGTEPSGKFSCDDPFFSAFWEKALRTLYVNMRDNYFDCPERERAQWWGDLVVLMGESFYTYSVSSHALMRKGIRELVSWAKPDGVLFSPIPGNYSSELPGQMLASVGRYGFWNYYMNTGDIDTLKFAYPAVKKYLGLWKLDETGLTAPRKTGWPWGDWGTSLDKRLIFAAWHYIALDSAALMADELGLGEDAKEYRLSMEKLKAGFNKCWNGAAYRHPEYNDATDDRVQALAVISGIADKSKYESIFKLFKTQFYASPYMEKYVMEALFLMGRGEYALERAKKRFANMVENKNYTTLFERWEVGGDLGGSVNHAWSGGPLTVIAQYLCGLYPLEPAWKTFKVEPYPAKFKRASIEVPSVAGKIKSAFVCDGGRFLLDLSVPRGTEAVVVLPAFCSGKKISINGKSGLSEFGAGKFANPKKTTFKLPAGEYSIVAE